MPREVTVRDAATDDVAAIQHVARATWHAAYDEILGPDAVDEQVAEWYRDDVVTDAVESDDVVYLVASDEDVVGYASAGPSEQVDDDATAQLYTIYVARDYWGDGIGSRLLDAVIEQLREQGYDAVRINVLEENDVGRSFYESHGFPVVEESTTTVADETVEEVVYVGTL